MSKKTNNIEELDNELNDDKLENTNSNDDTLLNKITKEDEISKNNTNKINKKSNKSIKKNIVNNSSQKFVGIINGVGYEFNNELEYKNFIENKYKEDLKILYNI